MFNRLPLFKAYDDEEKLSSNTQILLLITTLALLTYAIAKLAESRNRLNYENRSTRIIAGVLLLMTRMLHTRNDLEIKESKKALITAGPHRTGWEALVVASKITGTPPHFLASNAFNKIPGISSFMKTFKAIPVKLKNSKNEKTNNASALELASKVLNEDGCVALFPQGNFSRIGQEPPTVYPGAAKLAIKNKVPIHVIRLDGFWCFKNPLIPLSIRNSLYYRVFFSWCHMNNIRATLASVIDFHLQPENINLTDEQKIEEICAQLYAFYHSTEDLNDEQIGKIKSDISNHKHHSMWKSKTEQERSKKEETEKTTLKLR